jgi:SAM-dependent methyltransferase
MSSLPSYKNPEFDEFAESYEEALEKGLSVTGEGKEFFAQGRVNWLARCLGCLSFAPRYVLDFGCGIGTATPFLLGLPQVGRLTGIEVSSKSLVVARRLYGSQHVDFQLCEAYKPAGQVDLAFCNGVFHHIVPSDREGAIAFLCKALRPGGLLALWENNPWNPGTRYVMRRIPFDRDAVPLSAGETRHLLRAGGFEILRTDFLFIFPRPLRWLRCLEPALSRLPLGGQYQVLGRKRT